MQIYNINNNKLNRIILMVNLNYIKRSMNKILLKLILYLLFLKKKIQLMNHNCYNNNHYNLSQD